MAKDQAEYLIFIAPSLMWWHGLREHCGKKMWQLDEPDDLARFYFIPKCLAHSQMLWVYGIYNFGEILLTPGCR